MPPYRVEQEAAGLPLWNVMKGSRLVCSRGDLGSAQRIAAYLNRPITEEELARSSDYIEPIEVDQLREEGRMHM
jgi:hypothetical protein